MTAPDANGRFSFSAVTPGDYQLRFNAPGLAVVPEPFPHPIRFSVEAGKTTDVPEGETRRFEVDGAEIAVVNMGGGEFRAVDDICSHEHYHLSEGDVDLDDETIECPKHGSTFDLATGRARTLPAITPVDVFTVMVTDDDVLIEV